MDRGSLSEPENRLGVLNEPPCAEPHAGWCGGWRLNTSGYPISRTNATAQQANPNNDAHVQIKNKTNQQLTRAASLPAKGDWHL
ncbi:hypothetical protein, partial [Shewanella xiamenensis]|uniref:hypothetical protein n=1 Tax=Shewanella xiamenensis TaxID=332186 RepID=UPI001A9FC816